MSNMEEVREVIEKEVLTDGGHGYRLRTDAWGRILAAIDAAQPSGVDELYVVFQELAEARDERYITIDFFNDRTAVIRSQFTGDGDTVLARCCPTDNLADTVRNLIPKPEPTVEEEWERINACLQHFVGCSQPWPGVAIALEALAHLRKQVENQCPPQPN